MSETVLIEPDPVEVVIDAAPVVVEVDPEIVEVVIEPTYVDVVIEPEIVEVEITAGGPPGPAGPQGIPGPQGPPGVGAGVPELFDSDVANPVGAPATYLRFERDVDGDVQNIYLGTVD